MYGGCVSPIYHNRLWHWYNLLPLGLPTCRSDRVCKGRRVKGRCPRKGHSYFLNENRAFSAVNTALFARPKVYLKTNVFLNATAGYIREKTFPLSSWEISVGDTPAKWLFHTGRRFLRLPAGGALFPPIGGNEKKRFLSRTFNSLFLLLFAVKCLT